MCNAAAASIGRIAVLHNATGREGIAAAQAALLLYGAIHGKPPNTPHTAESSRLLQIYLLKPVSHLTAAVVTTTAVAAPAVPHSTFYCLLHYCCCTRLSPLSKFICLFPATFYIRCRIRCTDRVLLYCLPGAGDAERGILRGEGEH